MNGEHVVIIGGGQAASQLAFSLRQLGHDGPVTMIGEEVSLPYQRPPLSKKFLAGEIDAAKLSFRNEKAYESRAIALRLGVAAIAIDRAAKTVALADGSIERYDRLVLATGASVLRLPVQGADRRGVFYLRTVDDADVLRAAASQAGRAVIIGGGYIGLEVAATLRKLGLGVTVLEAAPRVMARVASPVLSQVMQHFHESHGITIRTGEQASAILGDDRVTGVVCADRNVIEADIVLVGIGGRPNTALAEAAGLGVSNGVVVDENGRTSDPAIYAAGDCTNFPSALYGARLRLESVQNAVDQAKAVAASIVGKPEPYDPVPWFWSDQFEAKLQLAGIGGAMDDFVVRGDPATMRFGVFRLQAGRVVAVEAVNHAEIFMAGKHFIRERRVMRPEELQDEAYPLMVHAAH